MKSRWLFSLLCLLTLPVYAKVVRYELVGEKRKVNLSGKESVDFAIVINGTIPAPTLTFDEGDDAEIVVNNKIEGQELSIHWHGILLPPEMDGVPYLTTPPIRTGESFTFKFPIRQSGTYWYHSHTNVQEQKGVYGAIVIRPKQKPFTYDREVVAVLSDWSDEDADAIRKNLRKDGDYYLYKKGTMRSWWGAIAAGSLGNFLYNEWTRMGGMDYSDVGYDAFLINGKRESQLIEAKPKEKIRIRVVNAAASTYFRLTLGNSQLKVVSSDGIDVIPILANEILIGMAETYDLLFEVPEQKNYELKITAQDGTGTASAFIGRAEGGGTERVLAPEFPMPDLYATMDHSAHAGHGGGNHEGHEVHAGHAHHHHGALKSVDVLTVDVLSSPTTTAFPAAAPTHDVRLVLGGDMRRYIWHLNGKAIHQDRNIEIKEGEVVRFTFENQTMMHHPMHLHGHFFRVVNQFGDRSPLKHTVDVPPHSTRTIEFLANEPGEWMLHCHNLYHLKTGMGRVVKYLSYTPSPKIAHWQHEDPHHHDHLYFYGMAEAATNHGQGRLRLSNTWNEIEGRFEIRKDFDWGIEGDLFYRRWFGRYLSLVGGAGSIEGEHRAMAGVSYLLPFLIEAQLLIDHKGDFRLDLEKRFQWTKYFFTDVDVTLRTKLESEFEVTLMYGPHWSWAGGFMVTEKSVGAGIQFQF